MKKLAMSVLFLMLMFGSAVAHDGALSLFRDATLGACSAPIGMFEIDTIMMYYVRDDGPDLGKALEFRIEMSIAEALPIGYEWNSQIVLEFGNIMDGISITGATCLGSNQTEVYIGSLYIMYAGAFDDERFTAMVKEDPAAQPPGIYITLCAEGNPMWPVLGGTFVFNGNCSTGVKETSWGAIKELYR
ncbi:MAG: hypothetical protein WC674_01950 [Candidatus Krumholzibacteriia bacterium]